MPTVCKITLDAEQYRQELSRVVEETRAAVSSMNMGSSASTPEVPQVEDQEYAITGVVNAPEIPEVEDQTYTVRSDIDIPEAASDALGDIADNAADAASEVGKAGGKIGFFNGLLGKLKGASAGEQIGKGATAVGAIGVAAGASVPPVGALAAVVNALLSPIALITMALTALMAIGKAVWDALTISAEEYGAQAEHAAKMAERENSMLKDQAAAAAKYMDRLKELNTAEQSSQASKIEVLSLLKSLQKEYGNLGVQIDKTTGKITNLTEVEKNLRRVQANKEAGNLRSQADAMRRQARVKYMKGLGDSYWWSESGAGSDWDKRMSRTNDINAQIADLYGVYNWAEKNGHYASVLKGISESIHLMEEARKLQNRAEELERSGFGGDAEAHAAVADARRAAAQERSNWLEARKAALKQAQEDAFENASSFQEKTSNRQSLLDKEVVYYEKLRKYQHYLNQQRQKISSKYSPGQQYSAEDAIAIAQWDEKIARTGTRIVDSETKQVALRKQLKNLARQEAEEQKKIADAKRRLLDDAEFEFEYNLLIFNGMYNKAAALKQEHDLREKSLKLSRQEKQELKEAALAQAQLNLQTDLRQKAWNLKYNAMEKIGRGREADLERSLRDARALKGRKLDSTENAWIKKLNDLTFKLDNISELRLGDLSIKTNALASRGGFQGSVRMPSSVRYNRLISEHTKQLLSLVQEIKNVCRDLGRF